MALGKTIKLYLIDGVAVGPVAAESAQLDSRKAYKKCPMQQLFPTGAEA